MSVILLDALIFHVLKSNSFVMTLKYNRNVPFCSWWECSHPHPFPLTVAPVVLLLYTCPLSASLYHLADAHPISLVHWDSDYNELPLISSIKSIYFLYTPPWTKELTVLSNLLLRALDCIPSCLFKESSSFVMSALSYFFYIFISSSPFFSSLQEFLSAYSYSLLHYFHF